MKKIFSTIIFMLALLCVNVVPCYAAEEGALRLVDGADLLTDSEESSLTAKLDEISIRQSCDIVVVTTDSLGDENITAYADDYFDYNGYGIGEDKSGILLLISMTGGGHGDYWMSTTGYGITAFTDAGIQYIGDAFKPYLKDGEYAEALDSFAENCDKFLTQAKKGSPYDIDHMPKDPYNIPLNIAIGLLIGLVIAFVVVSVMKSKLKSVSLKGSASDYVKNGSLNLTESNDIFLYRTISRHARPKETSSGGGGGGGSSTHTSSSGSSHGGGGGSF